MIFNLQELTRFGSRYVLLGCLGLGFEICSLSVVQAQTDPIERTFTEPRPEVEKAVTAAKEIFHGKLPALEGFVGQTQHPIERYERAYYQCLFQVIPSMSGEISVRVTAKVTAWYDDPDKQRSGYEVLPSNGRLENDALDRVQETLEGDGATIAKDNTPPKYNLSLGSAIPRRSTAGSGALKDSRSPALKIAPGSVGEQDIQDLRKKRVAAEKRVQQLNGALENLQELYENQTSPHDLVAIKKTGTPVYTRPEEAGKVLFTTTAKDQFQMLEIKGEWVRVQISGESRGWIRKSQLEFEESSPAQVGAAANTAAADSRENTGSAASQPTASTKSSELFRITREETGLFPGNWEPLRGKSVKMYSVQPAQSPGLETAPREKRNLVKELFLRGLKEQAASPTGIAGVVVVFDSADGGQASATIDSLKQWQEGKIAEAALWQACSLDPPETFVVRTKKP